MLIYHQNCRKYSYKHKYLQLKPLKSSDSERAKRFRIRALVPTFPLTFHLTADKHTFVEIYDNERQARWGEDLYCSSAGVEDARCPLWLWLHWTQGNVSLFTDSRRVNVREWSVCTGKENLHYTTVCVCVTSPCLTTHYISQVQAFTPFQLTPTHTPSYSNLTLNTHSHSRWIHASHLTPSPSPCLSLPQHDSHTVAFQPQTHRLFFSPVHLHLATRKLHLTSHYSWRRGVIDLLFLRWNF